MPAAFLAVQVYWPLCRYPTLVIIRMLVRVPIMEVVMEGSDEMTSPLRLQETVSGSSPLLTLQVTWTKSPSLETSVPKVKGTMTGGSEIWIGIKLIERKA